MQYCSIFIILYSTIVIGYLLSMKYLLLIYLNILIVLLLELLCINFNVKFKRIVHYVFFLFSITLIHKLDFISNKEQNLLIQVSLAWLNAKLLSFSIDFYDNDCGKNSISHSIDIRLAYLLYFPPFFFGPIYHFCDFKKSVSILPVSLSIIDFFISFSKLDPFSRIGI